MGKRGHIEGVRQRKDGRWQAVVELARTLQPDGTRKRNRIYLYAATRNEADELRQQALRDRRQGLLLVAGKVTVGAYLAEWLEMVKPRLRPSTYRTYEGHVRLHITPEIGHVLLQKLEPWQVQAMLNNIRSSRPGNKLASRSTAKYSHAVLRSALDQALKWGLVVRNVAVLVDPPSERRRSVQPFTPDQAHALLAAVKGDRLEAFYTVALALGLRLGEALGLQWEDVDLERGTLQVRRTLQRVGGKLQTFDPKTDSSTRTIRLPGALLAALREHRKGQLEDRMLAGPDWRELGYVFTTRHGTPLEPSNVRRHFHRVLAQAGLPKLRVHDMRHTAASLMIALGIPPKVVSEILGHSSTRLTLDLYGHLYDSARIEAASKMDDFLSGS